MKTQFSLRESVVLTAAVGFWVWIFREMSPVEIAVFSGVAMTAGVVGHIVYTRWLPWRVTVIATVLLLYNSLLGVPLLLSASGEPWLLVETVVLPFEMIWHAKSSRDILFVSLMVLGTLTFTSAHCIRPSLPTAIVSALGIAIWYVSSIMIMIYAG